MSAQSTVKKYSDINIWKGVVGGGERGGEVAGWHANSWQPVNAGYISNWQVHFFFYLPFWQVGKKSQNTVKVGQFEFWHVL